MPSPRDAFAAEQRAYWETVEAERFRWQTQSAYLAREEAALLDRVHAQPGQRVLEVGCGEGANLFHLHARLPGVTLVGVDYVPGRVRHVTEKTGALALVADATRLPLADRSFDVVLIRDLLHHLPDSARAPALAEVRRVLVPGGAFVLVEPNGRSPIIAAAALVTSEERGMLAQNPDQLETEVRHAGFLLDRVENRQPLPISRVVFHHRMGAPALEDTGLARAVVRVAERAAALLPRPLWAYVVVSARKPG